MRKYFSIELLNSYAGHPTDNRDLNGWAIEILIFDRYHFSFAFHRG